jgi:ferredoxin
MSSKFIPRAKLEDWLEELSARFEVWTPVNSGQGAKGAVVYRPFAKGVAPELERKPVESAKLTIFPRSETLINFKSASKEGKASLELHVPEDPPARLVFGLPSCDARGFRIFDPVYDGSGTRGLARDNYYLRRRNSTILVVKACSRILNTCFCTWVGGGPACAEGADVLATELPDGFVLAPLTDRGKGTLDSALLRQADEQQENQARRLHEEAAAAFSPAPDLSDSGGALLKKFDDLAFWEAEASKCLSCGACTYLCPTCYCFNITDEARGVFGARIRNWDACMTPLFTLEASGHNPRQGKIHRLRNRIGHKFSYYPGLHQGRIACCGCGRCIKSCPSSVDIRRIVTDAIGITRTAGLKEQKNG